MPWLSKASNLTAYSSIVLKIERSGSKDPAAIRHYSTHDATVPFLLTSRPSA